MPKEWRRDQDLEELVRAIDDDPSIQLDLLRQTNNDGHALDPSYNPPQVPFPMQSVSATRLATMSVQMRVLNRAKSRLGEGEDSHGRSKAGIWYGDRVHNSGFDAAPWCDMFAGEVMFDEEGEPLLDAVGAYALTTAHAAFLHKHGVTSRPGTLTPGALAFQNWDLDGTGNDNLGRIDHVEFVERDNGDGTATFVGGNVANGVRRRTRSKRYLVVQAEWWKLYHPSGAAPSASVDWWAPAGGRR